jgi:hypothetical protein
MLGSEANWGAGWRIAGVEKLYEDEIEDARDRVPARRWGIRGQL